MQSLLILVLVILSLLLVEAQSCAKEELQPDYSIVFLPEQQDLHGAFGDLPGFTRSRYQADHALIAPESRVWLPNAAWPGCKLAHLVSKGSGAHFSMFLTLMQENGRTTHRVGSRNGQELSNFQRFVLVLEGQVRLEEEEGAHTLIADDFAYLPSNSNYTLSAIGSAGLLVYERMLDDSLATALADQAILTGSVQAQPLLDTGQEVFALRKLMPQTSEYLFNIHIMDFQPGEYLKVHEVHYNQHGLLMLQGQGVYRLADNWYPVRAGDAIWMAPFVPQWYGALGSTPTRYAIYKDVVLDPALTP